MSAHGVYFICDALILTEDYGQAARRRPIKFGLGEESTRASLPSRREVPAPAGWGRCHANEHLDEQLQDL